MTNIEQGVAKHIRSMSNRGGVVIDYMYCTLTDFIKIMQWLKTQEGLRAVETIYALKNLEKKVSVGMTKSDFAWGQILSEMTQDYSTIVKMKRLRANAQISDLRKHIQRDLER